MKVPVVGGVATVAAVLAASHLRLLALLVVASAVFLWRARVWLSGRGVRLFSPELRRALLERDGHQCVRCKAPVHFRSECLRGGCHDCYEADHVEPWADGGGTTLENGQVLCRWCNQNKRARSMDEFLADPDGDGVPGVGDWRW